MGLQQSTEGCIVQTWCCVSLCVAKMYSHPLAAVLCTQACTHSAWLTQSLHLLCTFSFAVELHSLKRSDMSVSLKFLERH